MSTSQSDPGLPAAIDQQNKKFTTIIIYPTGKVLMKNPKAGKHNHMQICPRCCFSDAGEDNHTHGVMHFGFPAVGPDGNMLSEAEGQISEGSRSSEKFGVSTYYIIIIIIIIIAAYALLLPRRAPKTFKNKQRRPGFGVFFFFLPLVLTRTCRCLVYRVQICTETKLETTQLTIPFEHIVEFKGTEKAQTHGRLTICTQFNTYVNTYRKNVPKTLRDARSVVARTCIGVRVRNFIYFPTQTSFVFCFYTVSVRTVFDAKGTAHLRPRDKRRIK
jgi:hypothetical protein